MQQTCIEYVTDLNVTLYNLLSFTRYNLYTIYLSVKIFTRDKTSPILMLHI